MQSKSLQNHFITIVASSRNLEKLYQALLTISPTSVAVERMFSTSGWLLNQRRASMSDSTLDDIIFLKSYFERQKK